MTNGEEEIQSISVTTPGKGEASLTLTDRRVFAHFTGGFLGSETSSIPLEAISYVTFAWQRSLSWLLLAVGAAVLGFLFPDLSANFQWYAWGVAVVAALIFGFYKSAKVWVYSGDQKLGGTPESMEQAETFVEETDQVPEVVEFRLPPDRRIRGQAAG